MQIFSRPYWSKGPETNLYIYYLSERQLRLVPTVYQLIYLHLDLKDGRGRASYGSKRVPSQSGVDLRGAGSRSRQHEATTSLHGCYPVIWLKVFILQAIPRRVFPVRTQVRVTLHYQVNKKCRDPEGSPRCSTRSGARGQPGCFDSREIFY